MERCCIVFAGPVGSSKTPIAHYLSCNLNLPLFSNDAIRTEVKEDLLRFDIQEFEKRRDERLQLLVASGVSFIDDASMDRDWVKVSHWLEQAGYKCFVISLDLSRDLLLKLYSVKGYEDSAGRIDELLSQHQQFLGAYGDTVAMHITDANFHNRLAFALQEARAWIRQQGGNHG